MENGLCKLVLILLGKKGSRTTEFLHTGSFINDQPEILNSKFAYFDKRITKEVNKCPL